MNKIIKIIKKKEKIGNQCLRKNKMKRNNNKKIIKKLKNKILKKPLNIKRNNHRRINLKIKNHNNLNLNTQFMKKVNKWICQINQMNLIINKEKIH